MTTDRTATASCLLASVAVGASIAVAPVIADYPVFAGQSARYAVAAALLVAATGILVRERRLRRPTRSQLLRLTVAAATGSAGFNVLLVLATHHADPAAIGAVVGGSPVVLAVLGAPRRGRRPQPRPRLVVSAALATAGVVVLHGTGHGSPTGLALAVAVLACEVAFTLVAAPLLPTLGAVGVSVWSCGIAALLLAGAAALSPVPPRLPTADEGTTLLFQAVITTAVAFVLWYRGVAHLGPDRAGATMAAAPVTAALLAAVMGTGALTTGTVAGAGAVALGVMIAARTPRPTSAAQGGDQRAQPRVGEEILDQDGSLR